MSAGPQHGDRVLELLHQASCFRLAGLLLRRPGRARHEEIEALAREAAPPCLVAAVDSAAGLTEGLYHSLLGPGGTVSPREVSYRPVEDPGRLLAEIAAFYMAFGYAAGSEDPRDHIAVAADFVGFLLLKEAFARSNGNDEAASTTLEAREDFVERHLGVSARGMLRRAEQRGASDGYLPTTLRGLCSLAGIDPTADSSKHPLGDGPFLRAGLDEPVFDCGDFRCTKQGNRETGTFSFLTPNEVRPCD